MMYRSVLERVVSYVVKYHLTGKQTERVFALVESTNKRSK
jgi:hypothetical protein